MLDTNQWYTPYEILEAIALFFERATGQRAWFDPCCSKKSLAFDYAIRSMDGSSPDKDCLLAEWPRDESNVFMNPPYSTVAPFTEAFLNWYRKAVDPFGITLVNSATSTQWWQDMAMDASAICMVAPRIRFYRERMSEEDIRVSNSKKKEDDIVKLIDKERSMKTVYTSIHGLELVQPSSPRYESTIFYHGTNDIGTLSLFQEVFCELGYTITTRGHL